MIFFSGFPILNHRSSSFISSNRFRSLAGFFTSEAGKGSPKLSFITEYLNSSIGLSLEKAIEASRKLQHIKTASKPEAVRDFLIQIGLDDTGIRNAVSRRPTLLCNKVEGTLKPRVRVLQQVGFSKPEIARLISENPFCIFGKDVHLKIEFLKDVFSSKVDLLNAMIKNTYLLNSNLDKFIIPNISYLKSCGLSKRQIAFLLRNNHRMITRRLDSIKAAVQRAVELGFAPESVTFCYALNSTCRMSRASIYAKMEAMRSFGFSEAGIFSAILKHPNLLFLSVENIKQKLNFFMNRAGYEPSYIISHPLLLCFSIEKRLAPRIYVLQVLKSKGLLKRNCGLLHVILLSDVKFVEMFILRHREEVSDLYQVYRSAFVDKVLVEDNFS